MKRRQYAKKKVVRRRKVAPKKSYAGAAFRQRVSGSGQYFAKPPSKSDWSAPLTGAALGGALGSMIAPGIGTVIGSSLGTLGGGLFRAVTGHGDYTIQENSLVKNKPIMFEGPQYVRVIHREMIGPISSTSAFSNTSYALNPGLWQTFPWLSAIADQFEQYRFNGMIWEFESTSADALNSTNTALGQVILATDYDAADAPYTNQQQMLGSMFSNSGKPSNSLLHAIECAPEMTPMKWYYVRSSSVPSSADVRMYDLGTFQIATYGSQAAATIGNLWVSYDVTFQKKQMNNILGLNLRSDKFILVAPSVGSSAWFGTSRSASPSNNLGCEVDADSITFPQNISGGLYFISYSVRGASTSVVNPALTLSNCAIQGVFDNDTSSSLTNTSTTTTVYIRNLVIEITGNGASITAAGGTLPSSATYGDLFILQINGNMVS